MVRNDGLVMVRTLHNIAYTLCIDITLTDTVCICLYTIYVCSGSIADIIIIWARNTQTKQIHGFIVERSKSTPGTLRTDKMMNKVGLREIQNGHIYMNNLYVSDDNRLSQTNSFATGPIRTLILTRIMASWISVGM